MAPSNVKAAEAVRAPEMPPALTAALAEQRAYHAGRELQERRSHTRALLMLAIIALALSMVRAGWERVFYAGWWRQW